MVYLKISYDWNIIEQDRKRNMLVDVNMNTENLVPVGTRMTFKTFATLNLKLKNPPRKHFIE